MIKIYTDGACQGNPGPGGWGAVILIEESIKEISGGESDTTNNRMELMAAIKALAATDKEHSITLVTDSEYLRKGITQWVFNWQKNGWRTSAKQPVKNKDLWQLLLETTNDRDVKWQWTKAHAGDKYNERADYLARQAAESVE